MKRELVIVMDFGGQYNQLVARRVRECNVYCEIYSYKTPLEKIKEMNPKGIILTGGPNSCYLEDSPTYSKELFELGIPVLGLCYGAQLMQHVLGGKVERADVREYGKSILLVDQPQSKILKGVPETSTVWMSHFDYISKIAPGFEITTHTKDCPVASCENKEKDLYAKLARIKSKNKNILELKKIISSTHETVTNMYKMEESYGYNYKEYDEKMDNYLEDITDAQTKIDSKKEER